MKLKIFSKNCVKISNDLKVSLTPENNQDIYNIYKFISPNDTITALSSHKATIGNKTTRISTYFTIEAKKKYIDLSTNNISISGPIKNQIENIRTNSNHTINATLNCQLTIEKEQLTYYDLKIFEEIKKNKFDEIIFFLSIKNSEIQIIGVTEDSTRFITNFDYKKQKNVKNFLKTFTEVKPNSIIILENKLFNKDDFLKYFGDFKNIHEKIPENMNKKSPFDIVNSFLENEKFVGRLLNVKFMKSFREMTLFLYYFNSSDDALNEKILIGFNEIMECINTGNLKSLIISSDKVRSNDVEERLSIEKLIDRCEKNKIEVCILPMNHEIGKKCVTLGSICGIKKY